MHVCYVFGAFMKSSNDWHVICIGLISPDYRYIGPLLVFVGSYTTLFWCCDQDWFACACNPSRKRRCTVALITVPQEASSSFK